MVLSERDILKAIEIGDLEITPTPAIEQYSPSALDLRYCQMLWMKILVS